MFGGLISFGWLTICFGWVRYLVFECDWFADFRMMLKLRLVLILGCGFWCFVFMLCLRVGSFVCCLFYRLVFSFVCDCLWVFLEFSLGC